ncbi:hypothetical protein EHN06_03755 [Marinobacter sp. NP-4(2019)]|uniref:hypothetical protein n=1 Tax=Marinobacter sp. NP-4(2019) TaxID=2488665 RepID=UPI000FC3E814|nr:hypothetical protein [Marinobacter sp. NP-4(2019)]AZT82732.1 hypothetical protein EHN06_03755 [Marinobacter sp. NP-4(2019)]
MTMHDRQWLKPALMCLVALLAWPVMAQARDDLDVTMRMVVDDEELTNSVVREIELPEPMIPETPGRPERPDIETALEAMERGQEIGESASERAREAREVIDSERPGSDDILDSLPGEDDVTDLPGTDDLLDDADELLDNTTDQLDGDSTQL